MRPTIRVDSFQEGARPDVLDRLAAAPSRKDAPSFLEGARWNRSRRNLVAPSWKEMPRTPERK